jgi:hypothetical protein
VAPQVQVAHPELLVLTVLLVQVEQVAVLVQVDLLDRLVQVAQVEHPV